MLDSLPATLTLATTAPPPACPSWCTTDHGTRYDDFRHHVLTVWSDDDAGLAVGVDRRDWDDEEPALRPAWQPGTPAVWLHLGDAHKEDDFGTAYGVFHTVEDITGEQAAAIGAALQTAALVLAAEGSRS